MKMFRWSGLIGFIVFTALLAVIGFFFIDSWTKSAIEKAGFGINGAEVNVANVDLTLNPIGFRLENVQVADAEKPTHNALQLGEVKLEINFPQLFLGNVRINDLTVADVQTGTERASIAKVAQKKGKKEDETNAVVESAKEKAASVANQLPTPTTVVEEHTATTRAAVANAEKTIESSKQNVSTAVANLPGDDELASYKERIAEIKAIKLDSLANIKKSQQLITSVTSDIAKDKVAIETVKRNINSAVKDSKTSVEDILKAPAKDWAQVKSDYPFNKDSALKVARLLLGDKFFERMDQTKYWYNKAKPWLARLKSEDEPVAPERARLNGELVRYPHPDPTAAFQLDHGLVSFVADNWPWQMTIEDLTSHQGDLYKPVILQLRRGDAGNEALLIDGQLDKVDGKSVDTFTLSGKGIDFSGQSVTLAGTQLNWMPDDADVSGQIISTEGVLNGKVSLVFPKNEFSASGDGSSTQYVAAAVQKVERFQIDILVAGTVQKPKFSINSDIDNQLNSAFGDVAKEEYEAWLKSVRSQLDAEVAQLRKPVDQAMGDLEKTRDQAEEKIKRFEQEVESEVRSLQAKVDEESNRLKDKAAAELDAAQKKIEAEKAAAEEAARKEAEKKVKEQADKLKNKLKF